VRLSESLVRLKVRVLVGVRVLGSLGGAPHVWSVPSTFYAGFWGIW
jgi:hypothetical protein